MSDLINKMRAKQGLVQKKEDKPKKLSKRERKRNTAPKHDKAMEDRGRLPDTSEFHVSYDAAKHLWSGKLIINMPKGAEFSGESSGVFKLLAMLDKQYREWAKAQEKKP